MTLSVADIERWDPEAVREVFHAATARATSASDASSALANLPAFASWGGVAADAARDAIGRTRVDLDAHAAEAHAVAKAAEQAAQSFWGTPDQPAGSLPWMLDQIHKPVPGAPPHPLTEQEIDQFKRVARQAMLYDGVPVGQIEQRLNEMVPRARQPLPAYTPPKPQAAPPPGFGEGFADRWFDTEQGIKSLIGQGGPGAPGVLESWEGLLKGTVEQVTNPAGAVVNEVEAALDSPSAAYYLGGKSADAAIAAPSLIFGGEGAAVSRALGDIGPGVCRLPR